MEDFPRTGGLRTESPQCAKEKKFKKCPDCNGRGFFREKLDRTYIVYKLRTCQKCGGGGKVSRGT